MGTVPSPKTWVDGDKPDWKEFGTELFNTLEFLMNPPMCWAKASASTSLTNSTWIKVVLGEVKVDMPGTEAMFATSNSRITPKTPGRYKIIFGGSWDNVACGCTGRRFVVPFYNNSDFGQRADQRSGDGGIAHTIIQGFVDHHVFNGTTDYVELYQYTDGGTTNNGNSTDGWQSDLYVRWVSAV